MQQLVDKLNGTFALKQLGALDYFLGIEVHSPSNGSLLMTQSKYIRYLLVKTNMIDSKPISSPMASSCKLSKHGSDPMQDGSFYRFIVGALQYVTMTHPELSYSANKVCQFISSPLESHWAAVKRILRYLKGHLRHGLVLHPAPLYPAFFIRAFCDADWAADPDDRRSTSGAAIYIGPNLASWWSRKQTVVSRSSTEAEYRSLAAATADVLWIQTLLSEHAVPHLTPMVLCDNSSTVQMAHNPVLHTKDYTYGVGSLLCKRKGSFQAVDCSTYSWL